MTGILCGVDHRTGAGVQMKGCTVMKVPSSQKMEGSVDQNRRRRLKSVTHRRRYNIYIQTIVTLFLFRRPDEEQTCTVIKVPSSSRENNFRLPLL